MHQIGEGVGISNRSSVYCQLVELEAKHAMLEHAKPDQMVELVLPYLGVALVDGRVPENVCVDACLTLRTADGLAKRQATGAQQPPHPLELLVPSLLVRGR
ncbi:hypothetical protein [Streptomyces sp. NPDC004014]